MFPRALQLKHLLHSPPAIYFTPIGRPDHLTKDVSMMANRRHTWMLMLQLTCFRLLMLVVSIPLVFIVFFSDRCHLITFWTNRLCLLCLELQCMHGGSRQHMCSRWALALLNYYCLSIYFFLTVVLWWFVALWYPDWEGTNSGCKRDGNEPLYMTENAVSVF